MRAGLLASIAAGTLLVAACSNPPPPIRPVSVAPPTEIDGVWYLDQNWKPSDRQWYYHTTQGSQIMPYNWFMALEDPATKDLFHKGLTRFGYLPGSKSQWNPELFPVGFMKDSDPGGKATWFSMSCAACHTGDWRVGNKTMRIDGATTTGDLYGFIAALSTAIQTTLTDDKAFEAFARRVLGPNATPSKRLALYNDVKRFGAEFATFVQQSTPHSPWGPMRTDAFQMIFNRISVIDLGIPSNNAAPDAPVSYPYLWDTPYQEKAQWNGAVPNQGAAEALVRNAGEVLGVFGKATLKKPADPAHYYYDSTIRARNLIDMENQLRKLRSPVWPDTIAGPVDTVKAAAGKAVFDQLGCESCHKPLPRDTTYDAVPIGMTGLFNWPDDPQKIVYTFLKVMCDPTKGVEAAVQQGLVTVAYDSDPTMAVLAACRMVQTGAIAGVAMPPQILGGTPLKPVDSGVTVLANAVIGTILGQAVKDPSIVGELLEEQLTERTDTAATKAAPAKPAVFKDTRPFTQPKAGDPQSDKANALAQKLLHNNGTAIAPKATAAAAPAKTEEQKKQDATVALAANIKSLLAYKARPLDGVWATAPYMHNGSVPNLYEMLLPAAQRTASFGLGTTSFDPVKVGVDTTAKDNGFTFDTAKPGNRNTGHEFGASLTDEQRWQLVEYLKTL